MALNHRLTIVGSNINDVNLDLKVYLEGYGGAAVERAGSGDTLGIEWGAEEKQLPLIYGSAAAVQFFAENNYEFLDLFSDNARDVYIEALENDVLTWAGFIEAGKWSEPLIDAPYQVSFTAYDGLGLLNKEDFANADKTPITGNKTPLEILTICLNKTGLALPFNTAVNIRPWSQSQSADALTQYKIDTVIYEGLSCYEVMEQLFKNARIYQRGGEWYIIANNNLRNPTVSVYRYTSAGVANGTKNINTRQTGFVFEDEPKLELTGALKQLTINQKYGYVPNILGNSDFEDYDGTDFDNWTAYGGVVPEQRNLNTNGEKYIYIPGKETYDPWNYYPRTKYMKSDPIPVVLSAEQFSIKLKFALMGKKKHSGCVYFGAQIVVDGGTNYTLEPYIDTTDGRQVAHRWVETNDVYPVPCKSHIKNTKKWYELSSGYEIRPDKIPAYPWNEITDHFEEVSITPQNGIPATGQLYIYLFAAQGASSGSTLQGTCFNVVNLFVTDENAEDFATENKLILINDLDNNYVPDDLELINGDTPDIDNRLLIYNGQFILATTGAATVAWNLDGNTTDYPYAELMARLMASENRRTKQTYSAILAEAKPGDAVVFEDLDNYNDHKYFIEAGIKYNFRLNTIEGRFLELLDIDLDPFTLVEETTTDGDAGTTGKTSGITKLNPTFTTDEKVKLINPDDFDVIGQAGYLSEEYFDQVVDENTGRAAIVPLTAPQSESPAETPNGVLTNFTLTAEPVNSIARIYLNGIRQHPDDYTIADDTITFDTAPYTGDKIIVDYFKYTI